MARNRKVYSPKEKFHVVLELLQGRKTQAQITSEYGVHPTQQNKRKEEFMKNAPDMFQDKRLKTTEDKDKKIAALERKLGQLAFEADWLQKKIDWLPLL